jgi:hypothetical protein
MKISVMMSRSLESESSETRGAKLIRFNVHEFYVDLSGKGIIFCFSGPISQDVIEGIGGTLKQKMEIAVDIVDKMIGAENFISGLS